MRYSPNLNVIIKALDKISGRLARDVGEIENLQNHPLSAIKFANACYNRIKESLKDDLSKMHPDYNLEFSDGEKIINSPNSPYSYLICPLDGLANLAHALPYFATVIALQYKKAGGEKEIIAVAISNIANNQLFSAEKGAGAFLNNRRIRVSNREAKKDLFCALSDKNLLQNSLLKNSEINFKLTGCLSLDIANLAAGRYDLMLLEEKNRPELDFVITILKESGAIITVKENLILITNGKISLF